MRILEVSAVPPKIYAFKADGTRAQSFINTVKGALSYALSNNATDMLLLSEPIPRQVIPTTLNAVGLDGTTHATKLGVMWFQENKESSGTAYNTNYNLSISAEDDDTVFKTIKGDLLGDLAAVSMSQNAINYWEVPDYYISTIQRSANNYSPISDNIQGSIGQITSAHYSGSVAFAPPTPVYNNKARYCQSANITVYNPCSGSSLTKNIYDLLAEGTNPSLTTYNLSYAIGADIRPTGCPIFSWTYNDGGSNQLTNLTQSIKGGPWVKIPLSSNGLNGSYFQRLQQRDANAVVVGGAIALGAGALAGAVGGAAGEVLSHPKWIYQQGNGVGARNLRHMALKGLGNGVMAGARVNSIGLGVWAAATYQQMNQQNLLNARGICATYPQFIGASDFAQDVQGNLFRYCISSYRPEDLTDYDAFLERYGYYVGNMIIGTQHFWSREQFVYIKINDMTISSAKAGKALKDEVIDQLQAGVRIWRHKPNITAMNPGGNRAIVTDCPVQ